MSFAKIEKVTLKTDNSYDEMMVQSWIEENPKELGLGDLELLGKERIQPNGRLDFLFTDGSTKYEVEIQLGSIDESHLIRTIGYWDVEKRRDPGCEHCGVIIAEEISGSRFYNVLQVLNKHIPIIAIQMNAYRIGEEIGLVFTRIMDKEKSIKESEYIAVNADFWKNNLSDTMFTAIEKLLTHISEIDDSIKPSYVKSYISVNRNGRSDNFITFKPNKNSLKIELKNKGSNKIEQKLIAEGITPQHDFEFDRITISENDIVPKLDFLKDLLQTAYGEYYSCPEETLQ